MTRVERLSDKLFAKSADCMHDAVVLAMALNLPLALRNHQSIWVETEEEATRVMEFSLDKIASSEAVKAAPPNKDGGTYMSVTKDVDGKGDRAPAGKPWAVNLMVIINKTAVLAFAAARRKG